MTTIAVIAALALSAAKPLPATDLWPDGQAKRTCASMIRKCTKTGGTGCAEKFKAPICRASQPRAKRVAAK